MAKSGALGLRAYGQSGQWLGINHLLTTHSYEDPYEGN